MELNNPPVRPEPGPETASEIISATLAYVAQAREKHSLDEQRILIVTVPYDPPMREAWKQAEESLKVANIKLDWHKWDVWVIQRGPVTGGAPAEWLTFPADRLAIVPTWARNPLNPDKLRTLAAEAMAMAEHLEAAEPDSIFIIEGGTGL